MTQPGDSFTPAGPDPGTPGGSQTVGPVPGANLGPSKPFPTWGYGVLAFVGIVGIFAAAQIGKNR